MVAAADLSKLLQRIADDNSGIVGRGSMLLETLHVHTFRAGPLVRNCPDQLRAVQKWVVHS